MARQSKSKPQHRRGSGGKKRERIQISKSANADHDRNSSQAQHRSRNQMFIQRMLIASGRSLGGTRSVAQNNGVLRLRVPKTKEKDHHDAKKGAMCDPRIWTVL